MTARDAARLLPGEQNGGSDHLTDEEIASLPIRQKFEAVVNRSLTVFSQVGRLETAAVRAEQSAKRCEDAVDRIEKMLTNAANAQIAVAPRRRLESLVEVDDADDTNVRGLKAEIVRRAAEEQEARDELEKLRAEKAEREKRESEQLAALQRQEEDRAAVRAHYGRVLSVGGKVLGALVALGIVGGATWKIIEFAIAHAK